MDWPTPNDYDEAAENLRYSMSDEELRAGQTALDGQQLPMVWAGNFASVYRIDCPATGKSWALKCFTREVAGRQDRYRHIAAALEAARLPFTVPFVYLERGIQVHGQWFPAVKMEWVEGQTLNRFVEESLQQPQMLQQLLDLWPKLAARLREAGIAHADLQHGNILLVPAPDGKLALKLIDYDGMYVPALAATPSGELGHANYQHPARIAQRAYNADVDRFSHWVIYTAVRCLMAGQDDLWRQFNNDDNLLFREADFRKPGNSTVFRSLWELGDEQARALAGRLVLACGRRFDDVPWLDEVVVQGQIPPLSREEESQVAHILGIAEATAPPRDDALFVRHAGNENKILRSFMQTVLPFLLFAAVCGGIWALMPPTASWKLRPLKPQVVNAGDRLTIAVAVDNADLWEGKLRYSLGPLCPRGATINAQTGELAWLPPLDQSPGRYDVTVAVAGPDGRTEETSFAVEVRPEVRRLRLQTIGPQMAEAGKELRVVVAPENRVQWQGKLRFNLGPHAPSGAAIDGQTGVFTWTPPLTEPAGQQDILITAAGREGQTTQARFLVNVTGSALAPAAGSAQEPLPAAEALSAKEPVPTKEASPNKEPVPTMEASPAQEIAVDVGTIRLELVLIPAGEFLMGSPDAQKDALRSEKPQHRVRITKPFYLGRYQVTQEQWEAVMASNRSSFQGAKNPVDMVSWDDCQQFLDKLNRQSGTRPGMFQLPTEAQWEYACRAGSTTRYCFGDEPSRLGEYAWYGASARLETHPVGEKMPNAWGLYDMHGNVGEWCADWYDENYYEKSATDDPLGPTTGRGLRVCRKVRESIATAWNCRSACRMWGAPEGRFRLLGFRISCVPAESAD